MAPRVLCIVKDEKLRQRARTLLEADGFVVDATGSGLEGIARALRVRPDLVLAGVHLPDIEGAELTARLRCEKALASLPIVAVGGVAADHDAALAAGADGFLVTADVPGEALADNLAEEVRAYLAGKHERLPEEGERAALRAMSGSMAARLEAALNCERRTAERLAEHDRLKSAFVNNLAHELSTPLTPLSGYLRILLSEKLGALPPQQRRIVDAMMQSVGRLTRIVDNLSDFASLQAGQTPLLDGAVIPDALVDEVVAELRGAIRDARLHVNVHHGAGGAVRADRRKLRQALANVIGNAVKFSPHGGEVLVEVVRGEGKVRFQVYDQGPGIRSGEQERIFEPLYHAASRAGDEARAPGSGLGLPVARRIAEAHGGRVLVESPPRTQPLSAAHHFTGSKFVLELPDRPLPADAQAAALPVAPAAAPDGGPASSATVG
jgi:signal transduction histidine kinase